MGTRLCLFSALIAASMLTSSVSADEQTLKFRVVMTEVGGSMNDVAAYKGHAMGAQKFAGAAVFEDGRMAYKTVVALMDIADENVSYSGYSTYMFQNGDVLVVKFTGGGTIHNNGGDYEVVSGKGVYKGATGAGRFDSVKNPWQDADMFQGSISVKLAGG